MPAGGRHMQRTWSADTFPWDSAPALPHARTDYTLHNADCADIYDTLDDGSVDMLLTDPPYGITRNKWDCGDFRDMLADTWSHWDRIVKPDGAVVVMGAPPFDKIMGASNMNSFRYEWVWNKNKATGHLNAGKMPMKAHECLLVFYRERPTFNPQNMFGRAVENKVNHGATGTNDGKTECPPHTVVNIPVINNDDGRKWHPTQKPVKLMELMVRTYTDAGQTVLDPFMGSGATGLAALRCGRRFVGIEKDTAYFNMATGAFAPRNGNAAQDGKPGPA